MAGSCIDVQLRNLFDFALAPGCDPEAALETEAIGWHMRPDRTRSDKGNAGPLETAFLQHLS